MAGLGVLVVRSVLLLVTSAHAQVARACSNCTVKNEWHATVQLSFCTCNVGLVSSDWLCFVYLC